MRRVGVMCGMSGGLMFSTLSHKRHDFCRKVTETKMGVLIFFAIFL
jgi:hypothetical protein